MSVAVYLSRWTVQERKVMYQVMAGTPNKCIAGDLTMSLRTVEAHRASGMTKIRLRNALELQSVLQRKSLEQAQGRQLSPTWFGSSSIGSISG
ncbi:LuxR C-terminal-related transcriptional regulator [Paenalcaligenes sp.]|uniref:LuxR C-terminal-related transcriptional regulator n=1 Tax=Paenalcaligenes sp. TaxID=1966342 RepID=UPI00263968B2|nr:LuxR C-terminal-related transcriptional regulator [Paenalcaligenes sp.]